MTNTNQQQGEAPLNQEDQAHMGIPPAEGWLGKEGKKRSDRGRTERGEDQINIQDSTYKRIIIFV